MAFAEMGTNNIISIAQRKAQLCFQPVKVQHRMRNWIFKISDMQRNFCYELFDLVEAQRNSAIAERHFRTKLKRNITSANWNFTIHVNMAFLQFLAKKST